MNLYNSAPVKEYIERLSGKESNKIIGITSSSYFTKIGKNTYQGVFYTKDILDPLLLALTDVELLSEDRIINKETALAHYTGLERGNYPLILHNTSTFNPVAGATSPTDGFVQRGIVDESFGTIRAGAGQTTSVTDASGTTEFTSSATSNQFRQMTRWIWCFNTASLSSNAVISSAIFSLYGLDKANQFAGSPSIDVAGATPAATNTLATSDFGQCQTTSFGNVTYSSWNTAGYNDFTLNASGITNISKSGVSKFSTQTHDDLNGSFSGVWGSLSQVRFNHYAADNGSNIPKLVVTFTLPGMLAFEI